MTEQSYTYTARTKNELFYQRSYFAESEWIDALGDSTYCLWRKLITKVDRSRDALAKYGNRNTVPFSLARLAEIIGMTQKTLYKHARKLWNAGLIDFMEWGACGKLGKKPLNIVVYNYPQNTTETATKPLQFVRDYDTQYEAGEYPIYISEVSAEIYAPQVDEEKAPTFQPPTPVEVPVADPGAEYIDLNEFYATFTDTTMEPATHMNMEPATYTNMEAATHSNMYAATHNNIYNSSINNANAELIKPNASKLVSNTELITDTPSSINTASNIYTPSNYSSSSQNKTISEVREDEEQPAFNEFDSTLAFDRQLLRDVLETALQARDVPAHLISKIVKLAFKRNIPFATVEMINDQLDRMAAEMESGKQIFSFDVYFINGLEKKVVASQFFQSNTRDKRWNRIVAEKESRKEAQIAAKPVERPNVSFYNWLEEREDSEFVM